MKDADRQKLLDQSSEDAVLRLQYSDWLDEHGRGDEAQMQRWMARGNKRPNFTGVDWEWWQDGVFTPLDYAVDPGAISHRCLPESLFQYFPGPKRKYRIYGSRRAAEEALFRAWASLQAAGGPMPY